VRAAPDEQLIFYRRRDAGEPRDEPVEVWVFLSGVNVTEADVKNALCRGTLNPPTLGMLTELKGSRMPAHLAFVDDDFVNSVVDGLDHMIVNAFDGQALLFWSKEGD
jgi:hypothetical protein